MMLNIPTRSVEECEQLVSWWDSGEKDRVRKEFGGVDPSDHFLKTFRVAKTRRRTKEEKK